MHEAYLTRQDTPKTAGADDFNTAAFDKNLYKFSGCIPFIAPVDECVSHELTESYQGDFWLIDEPRTIGSCDGAVLDVAHKPCKGIFKHGGNRAFTSKTVIIAGVAAYRNYADNACPSIELLRVITQGA